MAAFLCRKAWELKVNRDSKYKFYCIQNVECIFVMHPLKSIIFNFCAVKYNIMQWVLVCPPFLRLQSLMNRDYLITMLVCTLAPICF